jgi:hypothetical protein
MAKESSKQATAAFISMVAARMSWTTREDRDSENHGALAFANNTLAHLPAFQNAARKPTPLRMSSSTATVRWPRRKAPPASEFPENVILFKEKPIDATRIPAVAITRPTPSRAEMRDKLVPAPDKLAPMKYNKHARARFVLFRTESVAFTFSMPFVELLDLKDSDPNKGARPSHSKPSDYQTRANHLRNARRN